MVIQGVGPGGVLWVPGGGSRGCTVGDPGGGSRGGFKGYVAPFT